MTINNKLPLSYINDSVDEDKTIVIDENDKKITIDPSNIVVIKRKGFTEPYNPDKMRKVCIWACDGNESYADALLSATEIKLYNEIKIYEVYDELIKSAVNKISRLYPIYEKVAAKLYLLKYYRETWDIKKDTDYTHLGEVIKKGLDYKRYNEEIFNSYSEEEIEELNAAIVPTNDYLFTYKALIFFTRKYCLNYTKNKKLELPHEIKLDIWIQNSREGFG